MSKKTVNAIIDSGNDYVIQVKGNQKNLLKACKNICCKNEYSDSFESQENSHGRYEIRNVEVFKSSEIIPDGWRELNRIISVERLTERKDKGKIKIEYSKSYYISSLKSNDAEKFAQGIRDHWSIENRLHWVKDVIQNEDDAKIKKGNGIETLGILKNIAINICRQNGFDSIKYASIYFASNVKKLYKLIRT